MLPSQVEALSSEALALVPEIQLLSEGAASVNSPEAGAPVEAGSVASAEPDSGAPANTSEAANTESEGFVFVNENRNSVTPEGTNVGAEVSEAACESGESNHLLDSNVEGIAAESSANPATSPSASSKVSEFSGIHPMD